MREPPPIPKPLQQPPILGSPTASPALPFGHALNSCSARSLKTEGSPMFSAFPTARQEHAAHAGHGVLDPEHPDTIETRLWLEEHEWLYGLLRSEGNVSPTFRFPDLISACVSLVFLHDDAAKRVFDFLGTQLVLRSPLTPRRRESMWRQQYELLLAVQRSPANRHPNPNSSSTS